MKQIIIGLAGQKDCGKTSAAKKLENSGFVILSFASLIRSMLLPLLMSFGFSVDQIELMAHEDKESIIQPFGKSYRQLMQTLGTEWGRDLIHLDLWIMAARCWIDRLGEKLIVFDDVRFENEAAMIRDLGGSIVHIKRGDPGPDEHASEAGINQHQDDWVIHNNISLEFLLTEISLVMAGVIKS